MIRRLMIVTTALASVALVGATTLAMGTAVTGPAEVMEVADRGATQVVVNPPPATATARYRVTLTVNWTAVTHPGTLPGNAHFSRPVLAVHGAPGAMFGVGALASRGIERMAEGGFIDTLSAELNANVQVASIASAAGIPAPASGSRTFEVDVDQAFHRISLVSMLAPSPDWFVGADEATFVNGQWIDTVVVPLGDYDSGTDSGSGFTSGNADTQPAQPISGPRDAAFAAAAAENPFATVTITRIG